MINRFLMLIVSDLSNRIRFLDMTCLQALCVVCVACATDLEMSLLLTMVSCNTIRHSRNFDLSLDCHLLANIWFHVVLFFTSTSTCHLSVASAGIGFLPRHVSSLAAVVDTNILIQKLHVKQTQRSEACFCMHIIANHAFVSDTDNKF